MKRGILPLIIIRIIFKIYYKYLYIMPQARLSYGLLTSQDQGGGNSKQGLPPSIGKGMYFRLYSSKATHHDKKIIVEDIVLETGTLENNGEDDIYFIKYDSSGQTQWINRLGGTGDDSITKLQIDSYNNTYLYGKNNGSLNIYDANDVNPSLYGTLGNDGSFDNYIVKYDVSGQVQWINRLGGTNNDQAINLQLDSDNNLYASGRYKDTINIYDASSSNPTEIYDTIDNHNIVNHDVYIVKYDSSGQTQWINRLGGNGNEIAVNLQIDTDNNLYASGYYDTSGINIYDASSSNPTEIYGTLDISGSNDIYIVKYDSSGQTQWINRLGGNGTDIPINLQIDSDNNLYASGYYTSDINIYDASSSNPTEIYETLDNVGGIDTYFIKYNSSGQTQWINRLGGNGTDRPINLQIDSDNNLYASGYYTSGINIYDASSSNPTEIYDTLDISGSSDIYIVKYDSSGQTQWINRLGGNETDRPINLQIDSDNNLYITGRYTSGINIYDASSSNPTEIYGTLDISGSNDIYIVKYDSFGQTQWINRLGGNGNEIAVNLQIDSDNNLYASSYYTSDINIYDASSSNPTEIYDTLAISGSNDTYFIKYDSSGQTQWIKRIGGTGTDIPVNLQIDSDNNIYITGHYDTSLNFLS
jgi:sugar lactone lactonase YvrE